MGIGCRLVYLAYLEETRSIAAEKLFAPAIAAIRANHGSTRMAHLAYRVDEGLHRLVNVSKLGHENKVKWPSKPLFPGVNFVRKSHLTVIATSNMLWTMESVFSSPSSPFPSSGPSL
jgi:hypothetical protein